MMFNQADEQVIHIMTYENTFSGYYDRRFRAY